MPLGLNQLPVAPASKAGRAIRSLASLRHWSLDIGHWSFPPRRARWLLACLTLTAAAATPITLVIPADSGPAQFAGDELAAAFTARGATADRRSPDQLASLGSTDAVILSLADSAAAKAAVAGGTITAPGTLQPEGFSIRVARGPTVGPRQIWVLGHDAAGLMYGGLEVAEAIRTRGFATVAEFDRNPKLAERGIKFNLPLDVRTPSYTDASDTAQQNIATVWDLAFWHEFIDRLARDRYNLVSLWNLHPFPSMVRVPEYPNVALADVLRSTAKWRENYNGSGVGIDGPEIVGQTEVLKRMTIDDKIAFWREVFRYGRSRNVKFYLITWNIFVDGTAGQYGITDSVANPTTADYFRRSVRELLLTYPDLAGLGVTAGENMPGATDAQKEDWLFRTYGQGTLDALAAQPGRTITFVHRQHETGAAVIRNLFAPLMTTAGSDFVYSFKYAQAHVMSSTVQNYYKDFIPLVGNETKVLWTLRNDDNYYFRWGGADFVRDFLRNLPAANSRGFYYGSDQWIWGRDFLDVEQPKIRQLELAKHWYHFLLWGRLGYEPDLSDDRLTALIADHFPGVDAPRLFSAWQDASMIYPLTTGFHWGALDFQWYIEGSRSQRDAKNAPNGFHDLNRFITLGTHPATDNIAIPAYVRGVVAGAPPVGTTPLQVADRLHATAASALAGVAGLTAGHDAELWSTLEDIRAMAYLGEYYSHKIRAATEIALFRANADSAQQSAAGIDLNQAAYFWRNYAATGLALYQNPLWTNRVGNVDWRATYADVLKDLAIAGAAVAVPSMAPTPGGTILGAADAKSDAVPVATSVPGYTGKGYRDFSAATGSHEIEWTFNAPTAGRYVLEFRYAMRSDATQSAPLAINGQSVAPLLMWQTGGVQSWAWDRKLVTLRKGANTIRLTPPGDPNLDYLNVIPVDR